MLEEGKLETLSPPRSLMGTESIDEVLSVVDTTTEDDGVLFPPPRRSTSSPITLVTQICGLFGFAVKVSSSPVLQGGLFGNEYELEKQGREYCCCSLDKTFDGSKPPDAEEDMEAKADACKAKVAA